MENQYNDGIQDIASMTFGTVGQNNNQSNNQNSDKNEKQRRNFLVKIIIAGIVVGIILMWLITTIGEAFSKREAKKALEDIVEGEAEYEDCYPEEIAEALEKSSGVKLSEGISENAMEELEKADVTMVKISGKKNCEWFQELVKKNADYIGADIKKKDIKVSKGYVFLVKSDGKLDYWLLIKVNGKYGFYDLEYGL